MSVRSIAHLNLPGAKIPGAKIMNKQTYHKPELSMYGNIRVMTRQVPPGSGKNDNLGGGNQKTQV